VPEHELRAITTARPTSGIQEAYWRDQVEVGLLVSADLTRLIHKIVLSLKLHRPSMPMSALALTLREWTLKLNRHSSCRLDFETSGHSGAVCVEADGQVFPSSTAR
jgi:hypothetical protein